MSFSLMFAAVFCFTTWTSLVHATHGLMPNCCPGLSSTRVSFKRILDYTIQSEGLCVINAIVFQTKGGKRICSDPNSEWAKRMIRKVNERKEQRAAQEVEQKDGSTPAASTTSRSKAVKKPRDGRRRQKKRRFRGGRSQQRQ